MLGEGTLRQCPGADVFPLWFVFVELLIGREGRPACVRDESKAPVWETDRHKGQGMKGWCQPAHIVCSG